MLVTGKCLNSQACCANCIPFCPGCNVPLAQPKREVRGDTSHSKLRSCSALRVMQIHQHQGQASECTRRHLCAGISLVLPAYVIVRCGVYPLHFLFGCKAILSETSVRALSNLWHVSREGLPCGYTPITAAQGHSTSITNSTLPLLQWPSSAANSS